MKAVKFITNIKTEADKKRVLKFFEGKDIFELFIIDYDHPHKKATFVLKNGVSAKEISRIIKSAGYSARPVLKKRSYWKKFLDFVTFKSFTRNMKYY
jgi:hypothetical protein